MKNINILRIDFDIDEDGNFTEMNIRTNIDLPLKFNEEINRLFLDDIKKAVDRIKEVHPENTSLFDMFSTAIYNSGMCVGNKITNKQFKNAREMSYVRKPDKGAYDIADNDVPNLPIV